MKKTTVLCPAKVNLGLCVGPKQPDGYHPLSTTFQAIALFDWVTIEIMPEGTGVDIACDIPELEAESNLAVRAVHAVLKETGVDAGVKLSLVKNIPMGAGLGGGSSDAGGVLRVLPRLLGRRIEKRRLHEIARSLGADVPFFLLGGKAAATGRGDILKPLPDGRPRTVLVVHPGIHISTAAAYGELDRSREALTINGARNIISSSCGGISRLRNSRLKNDFEAVVFPGCPELARLKAVLTRAGASPALLSGSGSAMFGMFASAKATRSAAAIVRRNWPGWRIWETRTLPRRFFQRTRIA